jgi:hypothetical protein
MYLGCAADSRVATKRVVSLDPVAKEPHAHRTSIREAERKLHTIAWRRRIELVKHSKRARASNRSRQFGDGDAAHSRLLEWMTTPDQFRESRVHSRIVRRGGRVRPAKDWSLQQTRVGDSGAPAGTDFLNPGRSTTWS